MPRVLAPALVRKELDTVAFYWRAVVRPHAREVGGLLLVIASSAILDAISVGLTVPILDMLTNPGRASQSRVVVIVHDTLQALGVAPIGNRVVFALLVVVSVFFVLRSALFLWNQCWTSAMAVRLRSSLKVSLFEKFLRARYEEIAKRSRGTIVHDINGPSESLAAAITTLGSFCTGLFNSALMITLLFYLSWWATVLLGVLAIAGVQGWWWYADRRAAAQGRELYALRGEQSKLQVDAIDGLKVVKAHGLEPRMVQRQAALLSVEFRPELQLVFLRSGPIFVNEVTAIAIVLLLGAITFLVPSLGIRFSMLGAFLLAMRRIAPAMASINTATVTLNRYKADLEMIEEVLQALPQEPQGGIALEQVNRIHLADVSFAYASRPEHRVLDTINLAMKRGTVTALVGSTGAGKSTVANLLLGLYEPLAGAVLVNGENLRRLDLGAWRQKIGYVSQDIFVFNASIRENIALGELHVSAAQIEWAARVAQLHEFIVSLPQGYETVIGDRGLRLSGGQCQRLAIARAIFRRPEVLIFDEATSALDNVTERAVYEAISSLHHEAIILVIAHRLGTVKEADHIVVLQAGRVVECGRHEALIGQRGVYARLYEEDSRHVPTRGADADQAATVNVGSVMP